ncbi:beta-ketoacyl-ACP synthase [Priestia aryabhattai]
MNRRVVVTGMGIISSIGNNLASYEESLTSGKSGISFLGNITKNDISVKIGAPIRDFSYQKTLKEFNSLPKKLIEKASQFINRYSFAVQATILSALEAWEQSKLYKKEILSERLGIIVAGSNLTQHLQYDLYEQFQLNPEYLTPRYGLQFMDTDYLGALSDIFDIHGEGMTVGGASASGNVGIIKGVQAVKFGLMDACMVSGPLINLSPMEMQGFYNMGAMGGKTFKDDPHAACRPFDVQHEGFIYGQASGCIILESLESAKQRGVPILAEVVGGAIVLDGNHLSNPSEEGELRVMELALKQAQINAEEIDYLNSHGSSSPLGDRTEVKAIRQVFEKNLSELWINSTKSLTGHCLNSAGIVEIITSIIQIQKGFIHPNLNLNDPIDQHCKFNGNKAINANIKFAMSNSYGFGGINSSIVLKKII